MPYRSRRELPSAVRRLPPHAQDIYRAAFNRAMAQYHAEDRAHAVAWSAVKTKYRRTSEGTWVAKDLHHLAIPITKVDPAQHRVWGWASVAVTKDGTPMIDLQGDLIEVEDLEEAFYDYCKSSREMNLMHQGPGIGTLIECWVSTPEKMAKMGIPAGTLPIGAWVGFEFEKAEDFARIRQDGLLMFSIEGVAVREALDGDTTA